MSSMLPEKQTRGWAATGLLGPFHNAPAVLPRALQREHARRPALFFTVRGHPQVLGSEDAPAAMAAGGMGVHGGSGCRHQLVCYRSPCIQLSQLSPELSDCCGLQRGYRWCLAIAVMQRHGEKGHVLCRALCAAHVPVFRTEAGSK